MGAWRLREDRWADPAGLARSRRRLRDLGRPGGPRRGRRPLPEGVPNAREWGVGEVVQERLGPYASSLQLERVSTRWEFDSFEHAMQTCGSAGPSVMQRRAMSDEQLQKMGAQAYQLMQRHNRASDGRVVVEPEYLQVVARKRG